MFSVGRERVRWERWVDERLKADHTKVKDEKSTHTCIETLICYTYINVISFFCYS